MDETKNLSGALLPVAEPKTPQHPNYTGGSCVIAGRRYGIAGWVHTIQQGAHEC